MKPDQAFKAVDALVAAMDPTEQSRFFEHLRATYTEQLGPVAVNGASAEAATGMDSTKPTAARQEKTDEAAVAMPEYLERQGMVPEDFAY